MRLLTLEEMQLSPRTRQKNTALAEVHTSRSYDAIKSVHKSQAWQAVLEELVRKPEPSCVIALDNKPTSPQDYHNAPITHTQPTLFEADGAAILAEHEISIPNLAKKIWNVPVTMSDLHSIYHHYGVKLTPRSGKKREVQSCSHK